MKIQQLIYTSVKYALSDSEKGLANRPGYRVYSCSEGLSREDIQEIIKYSGYRLPDGNDTDYPTEFASAEVADKFPKCFRTLKLKSGKYVAIQSVFAGTDYQGNPGNFFSHAFIFSETDDTFEAVDYYNSPAFRTHLEPEDVAEHIVKYLPETDEIPMDEALGERVCDFTLSHREQLGYLWQQMDDILKNHTYNHMCIATSKQEESDLYLISLKKLLPAALREGISTYNVFLPSDKHKEITLHATLKGNNNVTDKSIEAHINCLYVDMDEMDFSETIIPAVFDFDYDKLMEYRKKYNFKDILEFEAWLETYDTQASVGMKLMRLKKFIGDDIYRDRALELFENIDKDEMTAVRYDILKGMYENLDLFPADASDISDHFLAEAMEHTALGTESDLTSILDAPEKNALAVRQLDHMMSILKRYEKTMTPNAKLVLLRFFAVLKKNSGYESWRAMFGENLIGQFIKMTAGVIVTDQSKLMKPNIWTDVDMAEMVALIHGCTIDETLLDECSMYILDHKDDIDWSKYQISFKIRPKSDEDAQSDHQKLLRWLNAVGYMPYGDTSYDDIRTEIIYEVETNPNPMSFALMMEAVYHWKDSSGNPMEAQSTAEYIRDAILHIKEYQPSLYCFVFPKLALELLESEGHYHDIIINADTMYPEFWTWFMIGYDKCRDDQKKIIYEGIFDANKNYLASVPNRRALFRAFTR